jgi:hypothetical protein
LKKLEVGEENYYPTKQKIILIKACLASIPNHLMSVIKFPKWAISLINSQMAHVLWDDYDGHRKYHLANWGMVSL